MIRPLFSGSLSLALMAVAALCASAQVLAYTAEDYKHAIPACLKARDYACAQKNYEHYLQLRPDDTFAIVNLGQVMAWQDNYQGAITQYEKAIGMGEGAYNLFAYYADALAKAGRFDEAIEWSYRSLSIVPTSLDVRGNLSKLLVRQKRCYEALSLLSSYDAELIAKGETPYFAAQRIAIESSIDRNGAATSATEASLRLPRLGKMFVAPVTLGESHPASFLVDTGADTVLVNDRFLDSAHVKYTANGTVRAMTADGRVTTGRKIMIASMRVGPFELKNVSAAVCGTCALLLGQSALEKFDMKSSRIQGVEFMTLSPRKM